MKSGEQRTVRRRDDAAHRVPDDHRRLRGDGVVLGEVRERLVDVGRERRDVVRFLGRRRPVPAQVDPHHGEAVGEADRIPAATILGDAVEEDQQRAGARHVVGEDHDFSLKGERALPEHIRVFPHRARPV